MQRKSTYRYMAAGLSVAMLVAASCGDDDGASSQDATTTAGAGAQASTSPATGDTSDEADASATGSTSGAAEGEEGAAPCPSDQAGGELTFGIRNEPRGFDPVFGGLGSQGGSELTAVFDTLMRYEPESGTFAPHMAESLEPNDDHTEWTLTLRDDVTFASGNPVDTAAVEFTVDRHRAEDSLSPRQPMAALIESMEIVDDHTMVFELSSPWGNLPSLFGGPLGMIVDPETFESVGAEAFSTDPQDGGAGPFRLTSWKPGEEIVLEARDDYWNGRVCLDSVRFVPVGTDDARLDALRNGELDAAFLRSASSIAEAEEAGINMHSQVSDGGFLLMINNGARGVERAGSDLRVRQAIAHALDPELIDQRATGGMGMPSSALVPESSVLFNDGIESIPHDPEQAATLLEEVMADTGYDGSLHFLCNDVYVDAALAIQGQLEAVGFQVNVDNQMSVQDWIQRLMENADYDIACHSLLMTDAEPWATLERRLGAGDSPTSEMGYTSPAMDEAMDQLREAVTVEERGEALAEVSQVWNEEIPSAVYGHVEEAIVWSEEVEGLEFSINTTAMFHDAHLS